MESAVRNYDQASRGVVNPQIELSVNNALQFLQRADQNLDDAGDFQLAAASSFAIFEAGLEAAFLAVRESVINNALQAGNLRGLWTPQTAQLSSNLVDAAEARIATAARVAAIAQRLSIVVSFAIEIGTTLAARSRARQARDRTRTILVDEVSPSFEAWKLQVAAIEAVRDSVLANITAFDASVAVLRSDPTP